jgi:hypothetical protein
MVPVMAVRAARRKGSMISNLGTTMTTPNAVRTRLLEILRRHTRPDDIHLSDHEFITRVLERYLHAREQPLIDPNE